MKSLNWLDHAAALNLPFISGGNVTIYPQSHELYIGSHNVRCSRAQFRILSLLLSNFCRTVGYDRLLGMERQLTAREQNLLKVQIFYLRQLLREYRAKLEIRNIYGTGYQARPPR